MSSAGVFASFKAIRKTTSICIASLVLVILVSGRSASAQFTYTDLYDFNCGEIVCSPFDYGQLTRGLDGNFYGTTTDGGVSGYGTIFVVSPDGTSYTDLIQFDRGTIGGGPNASLVRVGADFYGTTTVGGMFDHGTIFKFTPPSTFTVLHHFTDIGGGNPLTPPTLAKDGNLYGVSGNSGEAYRVLLPSGTFQQLSSTTNGQMINPLFSAPDGYLYGASQTGINEGGIVFRLSTSDTIKVIHTFSGPDGEPASAIMGADGSLYGTLVYDDSIGEGEGYLFRLTLSNKLTILHTFDPAHGDNINSDGFDPLAALLPDPDGIHFYGLNYIGGVCGVGTIFEIASNGTYNKLFDFSAEPLSTPCGTAGVPGNSSVSAMMLNTDGTIYGVAAGGGSYNGGVFFSMKSPTPRINVIAGPVWVKPGDAVEILGDRMRQVVAVSFAGVAAQFRAGSDTYLTATAPTAAIDGPLTVTLATGEQMQSQRGMHILPIITNLDPGGGAPGMTVDIVGGGFMGAKKVTFGGVEATFTVLTPTLIQAVVPTGAETGKVKVKTPNGNAKSPRQFVVN